MSGGTIEHGTAECYDAGCRKIECRAAKARDLGPIEPVPMSKYGSRLIGDFALLSVGCRVWSKTRVDSNDEAAGGVIVAITEQFDRETGGIERAFLVVDPYKPRITTHTLVDSDVARDGMEAPDPSQLRKLIRRMGEEVGKGRGMLSTRDMDLVSWMHRLMGAAT